MPEELSERCQQAVELGLSAGADDVWANARRSRGVEFQFRDDFLEKVQESTSRALSLRLYVDGRYSTHSTTDLQPDRLDAFVREAVALTRALEVDPDRHIPDPQLFEGRPQLDLDLVDTSLIGLDAATREALSAEIATAARQHEQVISATASVSDYHGHSAAASSNGFAGTSEGTSIWLTVETTLDDGDSRPEGFYYAGARHRADLPPAVEVGELGLARAISRLGSVQGPTARMTMVVDASASGRLFRALLGPASAQSLSRQSSFWGDLLGRGAFSERLTVVDDPLVPRGIASRLYDSEGIAARRLPIIEAGRAQNLYVDTYYGRKTAMVPTTGSGSNRLVTPGESSLDELIREVGQGVYVTSWLGGNSDSTTGDFSFGIRGHLIENGAIAAPVGEMNVTGNLVELFSRLVALGNDLWPYSYFRAPSLVFEGVQFSGA